MISRILKCLSQSFFINQKGVHVDFLFKETILDYYVKSYIKRQFFFFLILLLSIYICNSLFVLKKLNVNHTANLITWTGCPNRLKKFYRGL